MEKAFQSLFPEAQIIHILDETLLDDFRRDGGLSPRSRQKALQMALNAQDAGADTLLVTCSTLSPSVDDFQPSVRLPAIKIDEPVIERILQLADRIALLATADSVLKSVEPFVLKKAQQTGRKVSLQRFIKPDLWPLLSKDPPSFYRAVGEAAGRAAKTFGAVLLTQVSMAPGRDYVPEGLRDKVYASPEYAVEAVRQILGNVECGIKNKHETASQKPTYPG